MVRIPCGANPRSTRDTLAKLRRRRPAPISSMSDSAISAITSALRRRRRGRASVTCASRSKLSRSGRDARRAGRTPNASPVRTERDKVKASTEPLMRTSALRRRISGTHGNRASSPQTASRTPHAPPATASSTLSVKSSRISRRRPAPSAARIASSGERAAARASARLATFAAAISSTSATAPQSTNNALRKSSVWSFWMVFARTRWPVLVRGYSFSSRSATASSAVLTRSRLTPGFMRASTLIPGWVSRSRNWSAHRPMGRKMSLETRNRKPAGMTPMTV